MPKEPRAAEFEQLVLLAILHLGENAYGMTIRREIEDRTERRTSLGAVYTTLDRLEKKGYVASWTGSPAPQRGGRSKRLFKVQPLGRAALRNSAAILAAMAAGLVGDLADFFAKSPRRNSRLRIRRPRSKPREVDLS
jgi:PadR family transcriptional regulator, regulatory protein PadR